jgi:hypothetical protein
MNTISILMTGRTMASIKCDSKKQLKFQILIIMIIIHAVMMIKSKGIGEQGI